MSIDRQEAIEFLVDHYQNPRNRGPIEDADLHLTGGNPGCADRVEMYAKVDADGRVEQVSDGPPQKGTTWSGLAEPTAKQSLSRV